MIPVDYILARSSEHESGRIIFFVVVAVIWLLGAIGSALKKKNAEMQRRQAEGRLPEGLGAARFPVPPPLREAMHTPPPIPPRPTKKKRKVPRPQSPPVQAAAPAAPARAAAAMPASPASPQRPQTALTPANTIGKLPQRPEWLRAALIMNEVLGPPLSLRPSPRSNDL